MDEQARSILNYFIGQQFGVLRSYPLSDQDIKNKILASTNSKEMREKLISISEVPMSELDESDQKWLRDFFES